MMAQRRGATVVDDRLALLVLLATRLKLAKMVDEIIDDTPLFAPTGLGLDSIDALELVLGLEKEFGVVIELDSDPLSRLPHGASFRFVDRVVEITPGARVIALKNVREGGEL
jgi:acyl carrier protein